MSKTVEKELCEFYTKMTKIIRKEKKQGAMIYFLQRRDLPIIFLLPRFTYRFTYLDNVGTYIIYIYVFERKRLK